MVMSNTQQNKFKFRVVAKPSESRGREITLNVCQGIGDILWVYQKVSPYFDTINFNIFVLKSGDTKIQSRAEPFLYLLSKTGRVTYELVDLNTFQELVASHLPIKNIIEEWDSGKRKLSYACNKALEEGCRIENIDPDYEILETVPLPSQPFQPLSQKKYVVLYVSGSLANKDVIEKGAWTVSMWEQFVIHFYKRFNIDYHLVIIGADFDEVIQNELAAKLSEHKIENTVYTNLHPSQVVDIIQNSIVYLGYQSGLSIIADMLDTKQVMLYYSWLKGLMYSWPKKKNIDNKVYNAFLWSVSPEEVVNSLPGDFVKSSPSHSIQICQKTVDVNHLIATYRLKSKTTVYEAAYNIAIGQSVGNPKIRNTWETDELYAQHSCKIIDTPNLYKTTSEVSIAYPLKNINLAEDGISQLMCFLMGGHLDIDLIESCHLIDVDFSNVSLFKPKFGISGMRDFTGVYGKPILGGIIKPKTGLHPEQLLEVSKKTKF